MANPTSSVLSLLALLEQAGIVAAPKLREELTALAAQYPDAQVPLDKAQALLAQYVTPEVIAKLLPAWTQQLGEFFGLGLGPPTFHPHDLAR